MHQLGPTLLFLGEMMKKSRITKEEAKKLDAWRWWRDEGPKYLTFAQFTANEAAQVLKKYGFRHTLEIDGTLSEESESVARELIRLSPRKFLFLRRKKMNSTGVITKALDPKSKLSDIYGADEVAGALKNSKAAAAYCVCSEGFQCAPCTRLIEYCAEVLSIHMPQGTYTACTLYEAAKDVAIRMRELYRKKHDEKKNV